MKTAISLPDAEFQRYERLAAAHGMNRSEFYRRAAVLLANRLEEEKSRLTAMADAVLARSGQPADALDLAESERIMQSTEW